MRLLSTSALVPVLQIRRALHSPDIRIDGRTRSYCEERHIDGYTPVPHQHPYGERISLELAKEMAEAGEKLATEKGWNATIAIHDDGGHPVLLHRMSNGQFGSTDLAPPKARAARIPQVDEDFS